MRRRLLLPVALLLLLASRADATPISFLFTLNLLQPSVPSPPEIYVKFKLFEAPTYGWPGVEVPESAIVFQQVLLPGVTQFQASLNAANLDHAYFSGGGTYGSYEGPSMIPGQFVCCSLSVYVAEPPSGQYSDSAAFQSGPPWISLANLGGGMSGQFDYVFGKSRGPIGTWAVTADLAPAPVPEPASMFLLGSGLAAIAARRFSRRSPKD